MPRDSQTLRRSLGLAGLTFYGVGMIVGAGVYSVVGVAAGHAGRAIWIAFAAGAGVAFLTALSYAELSAAYPRAGAEYTYVRAAFPRSRTLPFGLGFVLALAAASTAATVSLAFGGYLHRIAGTPVALAAVVLVAALTAVNLGGLRLASGLNVGFTVLEVGGLVAFVAVGVPAPDFGQRLFEGDARGVLAAASLLFFAYLGFEDIVNLAEEAKSPGRDLPRALLASVGTTALLYVAVGLAAVALVEPATLAASDAPLAEAAEGRAPHVARALGVVALFATANTALIALVAGSRMIYGMARDRSLPPSFARVSRRGTPMVAALALGAAAGALLPLGNVGEVASLSSFAALLAFVTVNVCLIALRVRDPSRPRPFRVPLSIGRVPIPTALALASALLLLVHFDSQTYVAGAIAIGVGLALHLVTRRKRRTG